MYLVIRKQPTKVNGESTGLCERLSFENREDLLNQMHADIGENIAMVGHPTLKEIYILYAQNAKEVGNFRLSYSGDWIHGTVYFIKKDGYNLTTEECDKIVHSIKRYIITKEYIAGAKWVKYILVNLKNALAVTKKNLL